jgi:Flp pilus assembly protein TadD
MPGSEVQWQPALVVLTSALVIGALLAWWLRRGGKAQAAAAAPAVEPLALRDLDGRVASLVAQLRELEATAAKRTPDQLARERYALELEAARALQARESLAAKAGAAAAKAPSAAAPAGGGAARGFLWGAGSMVAVALLVALVWQAAERRPEGGSVTGTVPGSGQSAGAGESGGPPAAAEEGAPLAELRAHLEKNPDDHDARLDLARQLLLRRDLMGVWNETQQVLAKSPGHPRALSYQALVRLAMGQGDLAVEMLKQAIVAEPGLMEAHQNLAFVYASLGRKKEAEAAIADVARRSPEDAERLRQALASFESARPSAGADTGADPHADVGPPVAASGADPHADVAPPAAASGVDPHEHVEPQAAAPGASTAPGAAGSGGVFGWIEADAAVARRIPAGTVVFVTVRPAGVAQGPPLAVKRLVSESLPLQFELGQGDSMMGQPLPGTMRIDVRADSDGDPMTRPASDPAGYADGVALGKTGVRIVLR